MGLWRIYHNNIPIHADFLSLRIVFGFTLQLFATSTKFFYSHCEVVMASPLWGYHVVDITFGENFPIRKPKVQTTHAYFQIQWGTKGFWKNLSPSLCVDNVSATKSSQTIHYHELLAPSLKKMHNRRCTPNLSFPNSRAYHIMSEASLGERRLLTTSRIPA